MLAERTDIARGIGPRIRATFGQIAEKVAKNRERITEYLPILEFIANRYPNAWLLLARLFEETEVDQPLDRAKDAVRHYLKLTPKSEDQIPAWKKAGGILSSTRDWNGEINALASMSEIPGSRSKI